ncbi:MAG: tRNA (adenosine(37)-N6)-threonylcarbamoyltransferase complex ATPase subunit type 1 TsaE, partial [Candidatus Marinimicrobia bacterium]|nr:tRNA (adenosine(37)-N6)-threonylcarbamoyltransferase complex ATPase subunit type 1 TsaE [Candidatus Neomarinimicrobiota bacterium]
MKIVLHSLQQTDLLGKILGRIAESGDVILLTGSLGAGKTTLTQSIATGLEVPDDCYVVSPSYGLMLEYPGRIPLYHIDCYRLEGEDDVEGSGLVDYIAATGLAVVEWPDRLGGLKPSEHLDIALGIVSGDVRSAVITPVGTGWLKRMNILEEACLKASLQFEQCGPEDNRQVHTAPE